MFPTEGVPTHFSKEPKLRNSVMCWFSLLPNPMTRPQLAMHELQLAVKILSQKIIKQQVHAGFTIRYVNSFVTCTDRYVMRSIPSIQLKWWFLLGKDKAIRTKVSESYPWKIKIPRSLYFITSPMTQQFLHLTSNHMVWSQWNYTYLIFVMFFLHMQDFLIPHFTPQNNQKHPKITKSTT